MDIGMFYCSCLPPPCELRLASSTRQNCFSFPPLIISQHWNPLCLDWGIGFGLCSHPPLGIPLPMPFTVIHSSYPLPLLMPYEGYSASIGNTPYPYKSIYLYSYLMSSLFDGETDGMFAFAAFNASIIIPLHVLMSL